MSYLKPIGTVIIYIGLFLALITFIPGLPPDAKFKEFRYCDASEKKKKKMTRNDPSSRSLINLDLLLQRDSAATT